MEVQLVINGKHEHFQCSGILIDNFVLTIHAAKGMKNLSFFVSFNEKTIEAHFVKYLHSQSISDSLKYFQYFSFDKEKFMLPLFVLLKLDGADNYYEEKLSKCLQNIPKTLGKGTQLICTNNPFGNKYLKKHMNKGIISNIVGENDCLILSDISLTPGTEGSPIFIEKCSKTPIGIVISVTNWWKSEWLNFTIIANLRVILMEILNENFELERNYRMKTFVDSLQLSFFQIYSGTIWGSCILLNKEKRIFITNSHVVCGNDNFILSQNVEKIHVDILYKNEKLDIAILKSKELPEICKTVKISRKNYETGDLVYAVGFPLFPCSTLTITKGNIIHSNGEILKTSCLVHPGSSGGGIVNSNGELLALVVCNAKVDINGKSVIFSKFNMNLPIFSIAKIIEEFQGNEDVKTLTQLNDINLKSWEIFNSKL